MPPTKLLKSLQDVAKKAEEDPKFFDSLLKDPVKALSDPKLFDLKQEDKDALMDVVNKINHFDMKPLQEIMDAAAAAGLIQAKSRLRGWGQQPWWLGRLVKRP